MITLAEDVQSSENIPFTTQKLSLLGFGHMILLSFFDPLAEFPPASWRFTAPMSVFINQFGLHICSDPYSYIQIYFEIQLNKLQYRLFYPQALRGII